MLVLFCDTDCDMTPALCKEYGYKTLISMAYVMGGEEIYPYETWEEFDAPAFYETLRNLPADKLPSTCAISPEKYRSYIEPEFAAGNDILYVHFSAALSGTFNALNVALEDVKERYPERKFHMLDTKAITIFSLPIIKLIGRRAQEGASVEELIAYGEELRDHQAAYFFADDLKFFAKSGRVTGIAAVMGSLIGIKPIISIGDDGKMGSIGKVTGKINAIKRLVQYIRELGLDLKEYGILIGSAGGDSLAERLREQIRAELGEEIPVEIAPVNPTAGCHCGPNSAGVSFHSIHR